MKGINIYTHRYIARVVLEAETPLFVGSGEASLLTDALVQKDIHGFPMISGTKRKKRIGLANKNKLCLSDSGR
jgi:hypothetical protein